MDSKLIALFEKMEEAAEAYRYHGLTNVNGLSAEARVRIDIEGKRLWNVAYDTRKAYHDAIDAHLKEGGPL